MIVRWLQIGSILGALAGIAAAVWQALDRHYGHHAHPLHPYDRVYPLPLEIGLTVLPFGIVGIMLGFCIGAFVGIAVHAAQFHRNQKLMPLLPADNEVWPPAPKSPPPAV